MDHVHRRVGKKSVTPDDIAGEPLPRLPRPDWNAFWRIDPRPDGGRAPEGPSSRPTSPATIRELASAPSQSQTFASEPISPRFDGPEPVQPLGRLPARHRLDLTVDVSGERT